MQSERPLRVVRPGTRTLAELQAEHEAFCKRVLPERKKTAHGADGRFIKKEKVDGITT